MSELFDILLHRARNQGDRPAFDDGETAVDYAGLSERVAATALRLRDVPAADGAIGLLGGNHVDWVVGQLAAWHAGRTVVPLPPFFPLPHLRHAAADAGLTHLLSTPAAAGTASHLGLPLTVIDDSRAPYAPPANSGGRQITYTSGSTGAPKGVVLSSGQMMWTASALADAVKPDPSDSYLSVLPLALLLETICTVLIPIIAGAPVRLEPALATAFDATTGDHLAQAVERHRPSCMVVVPQLLSVWLEALGARGAKAPDSLRFVAAGGAAVPAALAARAWQAGIPVHEGYGLTECGSVVALNRPGERKTDTVGRPLPGLDIRIEDGEIVVAGPPVMQRYLHGKDTHGVWRTGDAGRIGPDGRLTVDGRLDNVIVTPVGRNVSPEWIEALLTADPRIAFALVTHVAGPHLTAVLTPSLTGARWFATAGEAELCDLVAGCCRDAPAYAVPRDVRVVPASELQRLDLLTGNGRIRRGAFLASGLAGPGAASETHATEEVTG